MDIPDHDNAKKWANSFRETPFWIKIIIFFGVFAFIIVPLFLRSGDKELIRKQNDQLEDKENQIQTLKTELSSANDKKNELHRENLHLKALIDPIRRKAESVYPELETAAAVAKLSEDVQKLHSLATAGTYKPLSTDRKAKLVAELIALQTTNTGPRLNLVLWIEQGNPAREKLCADLGAYLRTAGWEVDLRSGHTYGSGVTPSATLEVHPAYENTAYEFARILNIMFEKTELHGIKNERLPPGQLQLEISGNPLFSDSGTVTFR